MEVHGFLTHNEGLLSREKVRTYLEESISFYNLRFIEPFVDDMTEVHSVSKIREVLFLYGHAFDTNIIRCRLDDLRCNLSDFGSLVTWLIRSESKELEALKQLYEHIGFEVKISHNVMEIVDNDRISLNALKFLDSYADNDTRVYDNITEEYLGEKSHLFSLRNEKKKNP